MTVANILRMKGDAVYTIGSHNSLADAAHLLAQRKIGALVVTDENGRVTGIIGEREIVAVLARGDGAALAEAVRNHMVTDFVSCRRTDSVEHLARVMTNRRIRHVPVVEDGRLCGVISIGDVVKHRIAETEMELETIKVYIGESRLVSVQ